MSSSVIATVDLSAIRKNIEYIKNLNPGKQICAVVKANAYGHGAVMVAKAAIKAGASYLAVARADEGRELRESGIEVPVILVGGASAEEIAISLKYDLEFCVQSLDSFDLAIKTAKNIKPKIHIKIDSGMGRLGINSNEEFEKILDSALKNNIPICGLYTHFATADCDKEFMEKQRAYFEHAASLAKQKGFDPIVHCANSAAAIDGEVPGDMIRLGIAMYGLTPFDKPDSSLNPAMNIKTHIVQLKTIETGDSVSYGRTFIAGRTTKVAVVPIGYGDGYMRILGNNADMLVGGKRAKIIGRVCMDLTMLDVTDIENVNLYDEVVVLGKQGSEEISAEDLASLANTINYEIVTSILPRVERVYINE